MNNELFSPIKKGRFHSKNGFVRSATKEELCDREGHLNSALYKIYDEFAKGGVGTIIVSSARVRLLDDVQHGGLLRLDNVDVIDDYKYLANICKRYGSTAIIQATYPHFDIDTQTIANFDRIVDDFVNGAKYAREAGFDGIQIHAAHTVGMSYILSSRYNHRTDEYGLNKNLLALRIVNAIRKNLDDDFILLFKVNSQDFEEGGLSEEDSLQYCIQLAEAGIDAIEVSGNNQIRTISSTEEESYFSAFAARLKKCVDIPVILVGGNKSLDTLQDLHEQKEIDMFSFSRALTCEPNLINRWQSNDHSPATCRFCNACLHTYAHACVFRKKMTACQE